MQKNLVYFKITHVLLLKMNNTNSKEINNKIVVVLTVNFFDIRILTYPFAFAFCIFKLFL